MPAIILNGAAWFAGIRHGDKTRGTKVFAVTGKVKQAQLVEVPMGTTLRQIVFDVCGGVSEDREIKAVQTGGPSGGVIPDQHLDTPVAYETLQALGSIMGSGGMIVMDKTDSMVDVAKFFLKFSASESLRQVRPLPHRRHHVGGADPHHRGQRHDGGPRSHQGTWRPVCAPVRCADWAN